MGWARGVGALKPVLFAQSIALNSDAALIYNYICSVRTGVLYFICETSQLGTNNRNHSMKLNKWLYGDLKPRHKKTTNKTTSELSRNRYNQIHNKPQHQRERETNTIQQPQNEQMSSRVGNNFQKRWQLCYPNIIEYILNLHNC